MNIEEQYKEILKEHKETTESLCRCKSLGSCTFAYSIDCMLMKTIDFVDKIEESKYSLLINNLENQTLNLAGKVENYYLNLIYGRAE